MVCFVDKPMLDCVWLVELWEYIMYDICGLLCW